jgi:hypothetical protein
VLLERGRCPAYGDPDGGVGDGDVVGGGEPVEDGDVVGDAVLVGDGEDVGDMLCPAGGPYVSPGPGPAAPRPTTVTTADARTDPMCAIIRVTPADIPTTSP